MKVITLTILIFVAASAENGFTQDTTKRQQLPRLLTDYYRIKNALVAGDANGAALSAKEFIKTANSIDYKTISEGNINILLEDAGRIAASGDLKDQRDYFANFSLNMFAVAKAVKLTENPIYQTYCPMKKAYWLSSEKQIKNPYYGSPMLSCGDVIETLQ